jgi:NTP pyrophosphatase (non-canonical NTP hydrolase)
MTFDEYQKLALSTAASSTDNEQLQKSIWVMGVAGEAGEVVEKWKKAVAYRNGAFSDDEWSDFTKELGDVVWYIAVLADSLGLSFEAVMQMNVKKLADRQARNVIKGAGDNR